MTVCVAVSVGQLVTVGVLVSTGMMIVGVGVSVQVGEGNGMLIWEVIVGTAPGGT